jgi:succinate dehydrogenase / fumarate reductase flavoprotein subunit
MAKYAPKVKDLASRDVVSRAMTVEINEGRGVGKNKDHVYLVLHHLGEEVLNKRLPGISESARIFAGVDVTKEPIPVVPTVHYNMGGIPAKYTCEVVQVDQNGEIYEIGGLMAIGEAACVSVHGANRLGSNSLLDLVVFGRAAAIRAADILKNTLGQKVQTSQSEISRSLDYFNSILNANGSSSVSEVRASMQDAMQKHAAVFRTEDSLKLGLTKIEQSFLAFNSIKISDRGLMWNSELIEALELDNLRYQAVATVASALHRKESRGAHARDDFQERDDENWMHHTMLSVNSNSESIQYDFKKRKVVLNTLTNEMKIIPPVKRVY